MIRTRPIAGIFAAGLGSRLRSPLPSVTKPLYPVNNRPLIHWTVSGLEQAGVRELVVLFNSSGDAARTYLERHFPHLRWTFLRRDTSSSCESFWIVDEVLASRAESYLISTVDALIPPKEIERFARTALLPWEDGEVPGAALALTRTVDDEKPLWAETDKQGRITALGDSVREKSSATCGLYALRGASARGLPTEEPYLRLRDFWMDWVRRGPALRGLLLSEAVDVDRPDDIPTAERFTQCFGV